MNSLMIKDVEIPLRIDGRIEYCILSIVELKIILIIIMMIININLSFGSNFVILWNKKYEIATVMKYIKIERMSLLKKLMD